MMTSLEIAELTGKNHFDLMRAIRKMEPAWEKVQGCKFALLQRTYDLPNGGTKTVPCYQLTKNRVPVHRHEVQRRGFRVIGVIGVIGIL